MTEGELLVQHRDCMDLAFGCELFEFLQLYLRWSESTECKYSVENAMIQSSRIGKAIDHGIMMKNSEEGSEIVPI